MFASRRIWVLPLLIIGLLVAGCGRGEVKRLRLSQAALQDQILIQNRHIQSLEGEVAELRAEKQALAAKAKDLQAATPAEQTSFLDIPSSKANNATAASGLESAKMPSESEPAAPHGVEGELAVVDNRADPMPSQAQSDPPSGAEQAQFAIHIASYRRIEQVRAAWPEFRDRFPELLGDLEPRVTRLEVDSLGGSYLRLKAGPFPNRSAAEQRCGSFKAIDEYCVVSAFDGMGLDESR